MSQKILVAEDDSLTQFLMSEMLDSLGYECDIAENGETCLEMITAHPEYYFAVLMDIHMPKMTGLDASRKIRSLNENPPKESPIYAVTADDSFHDEQMIRNLGFNGVLPKPVNIDHLNSVLAHLAA